MVYTQVSADQGPLHYSLWIAKTQTKTKRSGGRSKTQSKPVSRELSPSPGRDRLLKFLSLAQPPATHLLFRLVSTGLRDDREFQQFIDMASRVREKFLYAALEKDARKCEIEALVKAAETIKSKGFNVV